MAPSIGLLGLSFLPNAVSWEAVRRGRRDSPAGYRLPARHIIHRVAPIWRGGAAGERQLLEGCYRSCLDIACPRYRGRTPGAAAIS
jgi:hypothetical protein